MHNIAFFSNQFASSKGHGVSRYAHSLLNALAERKTIFDVIPVATWSDREPEDLRVLRGTSGLRLLSTGRWLSPLMWLTLGIPKIEHLLDFRADIVHVNDLSYLVSTSKPYIVTVHDLGPLTHPEYFINNAPWMMQKSLEQAIKRAAAFICVSKTTADSLMEYVQSKYAVDLADRVHVVREGIAESFFETPDFSILEMDHDFDLLNQPFILAVGKNSPRKNFEKIIRALKELQLDISCHLVAVGGDGWAFQEVKSLVHSLGLTDRVHFLGYVSDEQLHALYAKAVLFIYPSLFEGFGLPVLEAMASGCAVITSNISSLPEVAGDAALLVDPHSIEDVAAAMKIICTDRSLRDDLKRKGQERAKLFSWENCAEETLAVYSKVLANRK